ncbi:Outer membrane protein [Acidisarcina polymorpha]|uniref:Outer membrane protein n=1 Tax=Acidisarcina polymorpha TaxID=2211140 RepID=A0A2Z5G5C5_9BACT|nr:TolC family protein [Acidisarcina polymorpha]AXC14433.1 Outer membrane protein [Acidisarcina polymorpha]
MDFLFEFRGRRQSVPSGTIKSVPRSLRSHLSAGCLQAYAAIACLFLSTVPQLAIAQQSAPTDSAQAVPPSPSNARGSMTDLHPTSRDFRVPKRYWRNPFAIYTPTQVDPAVTMNSPRLEDLAKGGKIYLSLSDAVVLALENNYDIAIQRYNIDIADTDILRSKSGAALLGAPSGLVQNTIGTTNQLLQQSGGGPGGSTTAAGGAGAGASGLTLTTNGLGPVPEILDPVLTGNVQLERQTTPQTSSFTGPVVTTNTNTYDFQYNQAWISGTALTVGFNNNRITTNQAFTNYSPALNSNFTAQLTQHLLNGFGPGINARFIIQAKNDRRITDAGFRQQILYTVNQVENIYWGLVSAYEDVQSKQRALEQSKQLASDNRKQLQIGTLAPLDVVQSDSNVASDQQALVNSQSALEYQQLVIKQAIARNLSDPGLAAAPVIPTDRVSILETPEERMSVEDLVKQADANRPDIQQAILALKNDEITLRAEKNGLLPQVDLYAFYGASGVGGQPGPNCTILDPTTFQSLPCSAATTPTIDYSHVFQNLFNNSGPNKGVGVNLNVPLRNRRAQSEQARSVLEYRQAELQLQQIYLKVRMQVINGQFALTNDRAQVESAQAAADYNRQSLDSEQKKYRLGASTTANVLLQQRNLSNAENNLITARATYAKDRAALTQILADTLDRYGISLEDAVTGNVKQIPVIPGLEPAKAQPEVQVPGQQEQLQKQEAAPPPAAAPAMPQQPPPHPEQTPPPPPQPQ